MRLARLHHAPGNGNGKSNAWPAIDEVAQKDHFASGVTVDTTPLVIPQLLEQRCQRRAAAMDIADEVVTLHINPLADGSSRAYCAARRRNCAQ